MRPMPLLRPVLLLTLVALTGCHMFDDKRHQEESERIAREDSARRQERLRQTSLNQSEYEALSNKMGWARGDARGLPPPPTTEELEKRVKTSEPAR